MSSESIDSKRQSRVLILLVLLVFCLYLPTLYHPTFADDDIYLAFTNRVLRGARGYELYQLFLRPANAWEYLPVRELTYWFDLNLWDDELFGLHLGNLLWYALCVLALNWLLRELILLCQPASVFPNRVLAWSGTLLFAAHPAHVEAVAWIASRKDLVAATLLFLASAVLVRAVRREFPYREGCLAALLFFAACFGKSAAMAGVVFMSVLIGAGGWKDAGQSVTRRRIALLVSLWLLTVTAFVIHHQVAVRTGIRLDNSPGAWQTVDRASRILAALLGLVTAPYPLRLYHDVYAISAWHWLVSAGALALLSAALWDLSRRRSLWAFGVVLLFAPLLVYLQFVPFTTWSLASERFVFVPVAGLVLILLDLFGRIGRSAIVGAALLAVVLPSLFVVSERVSDWSDSATLRGREFELQPAHHNAVRDQIVFVLLPQRRYAEAADLASSVPRLYAVEALLALIDVEYAYEEIGDRMRAATDVGYERWKERYCRAIRRMDSALRDGRALIATEVDVSYNNVLRSLARLQTHRHSGAPKLCASVEAENARASVVAHEVSTK